MLKVQRCPPRRKGEVTYRGFGPLFAGLPSVYALKGRGLWTLILSWISGKDPIIA
jgi:hypothetical protein